MTLYRSTSYQHQSSRQLQQNHHQPTTTSSSSSSSIYHHYNNNTTINNSLLSSYSSNQNPLYELPQVSYPVKHIPFTFSIPTQISNHHHITQHQHSINTNISTFAWSKPCNACNSDSSSSLSPTTRREIKESRVVELEYRNNIISHMLSMEKKTVSDPSMIDTQPEIKWHMRPYLLDFLIKTHLNLGLTNETLFLAVNIIDRYSSQRIVFKRHYKLLGCTALWIASKYNDKKIKVPTLNELKLMCANTYDSHMFTQMELHILTTLEWTIGHPTVDLFVDLCSSDGTSSSNESFPHTVSCHQTKNLVLYLCELSLYHKEFLAFTPSVLASAAFKLASLMVSNYTTYYYYPENYKRNNSNTEPLYLIPTNKMEHSCLEYLIYFSPSPTTCLETKYSTQKTCRAFSIVKMFFQNCLRIKKLIFKPAYLSSSSSSSPLANIDNNNIINDSSSSSSSSSSSDSTTPKTSPKQIQHYSKTPSRSSSILSSSRSPSTSPNSTITATNDYETPRKKRKISSSTEKSLYYYLSSDLTSSSSSTTHGMVTPSYNKPNSITPVTTPMHSHIFSTATTTTTSAAKAHPHNHHNHHNNNTQYYHLPKPSEVLSTIKPCSNNNKISSSSSNLCRRQTSISTIITTKPTSSSLGYMTPPFTPDEEEDENKEEENNDREEEEKEEKNINQNDLLVDKKSSIITTKIVNNTTNNSNNKSNSILIKDHTKYPTLNNYHYYHHQQQQQRPAVRTISLDVENNYK